MIENLRKPIGIAYITENVKTDILATVLSTESQFHSLVAAVIAPVIGFFADRFGLGYAIIFASSILFDLRAALSAKKETAKLKIYSYLSDSIGSSLAAFVAGK